MSKAKIFIIFLICMLADQGHKLYMLYVYNMPEKGEVIVTSFFNLVMVWNRGVSFGMFQNAEYSNLIFLIFSSGVISLLLYLAAKSSDKIEAIIFTVIAGGALGNVIDRILHGAVADFFDFHINGQHWPAFNIADSLISCGAIILIIYSLFFQKENKANELDNKKPKTDKPEII